MSDQIANIIRAIRVAQWLKNLAVFAAIVFARELLNPDKFIPVAATFLVFCAASSAMYLLNDLIDQPSDQLHFSKKLRPIAAGTLSPKLAVNLIFLLVTISFLGAFLLSPYLLATLGVYFLVQGSYSLYLKNIIIIDVLAIALAFMLRVFAGSFVVLVPLSSWLILTTMSLSLFLGIGKRRSELTLLSAQGAPRLRKTLQFYPRELLDGLVFMMATATLITYSLFTFNSPEIPQKEFFISLFPQTLASPKILMVTIPVVVYGVFRYLYLVFQKSEGESPEKVLLTDIPLLTSVLTWAVSVIFSLYFLAA